MPAAMLDGHIFLEMDVDEVLTPSNVTIADVKAVRCVRRSKAGLVEGYPAITCGPRWTNSIRMVTQSRGQIFESVEIAAPTKGNKGRTEKLRDPVSVGDNNPVLSGRVSANVNRRDLAVYREIIPGVDCQGVSGS